MLPNLINRTIQQDEPQLKQNRMPLTQNSRNISEVFNRQIRGYENYPLNYQNRTSNQETNKKTEMNSKLPPIDKQNHLQEENDKLERTHDKRFYEQQAYGLPDPQFKVLADNQDLLAARVNELGTLLSQTIASLNTVNRPIKDIESRMRKFAMNNEESTEDLKIRIDQLEKRNQEMEYMIDKRLKTGETANLKSIIERKINSDQEVFQKQQEKSRVLFEELARLNQTNKTTQQKLDDLSNRIDTNNANTEARFGEIEKSTIDFLSKDDQVKQLMKQMSEKSSNMVRDLELNINSVQRDQAKMQDNINKVSDFNRKTNEELKVSLETFATDVNTKIEQKAQNLDARIKTEHDERIRSTEHIINQLEERMRLIDEKMRHEKESAKERYKTLENSIQWELSRKDEMIEALKHEMGNYWQRTMYKFEETQADISQFKSKVEEELNEAIDSIQVDLTDLKDKIIDNNEKIGEIVRSEIKARFESDVELKNLASEIFDSIKQEVADLQSHIVEQHETMIEDMRRREGENSERIESLSRYIDDKAKSLDTECQSRLNEFKLSTKDANDELKKELSSQQDKHCNLNDKVDQVEKTNIERADSMQTDFKEQLSTNVKLINQNISELNNRITDNHKSLSKANTMVSNNLKKVYQSLRVNIDGQIKALKENVEDKEGKLRELETNITNKITEINILQSGNYTSLKDDQDQLKLLLEEKSSKLQVDMKKLSQDLQEDSAKQTKILEDKLDEKANQIRELDTKLGSNVDEINKLISDNYVSLKDESDKLKSSLNDKSEQLGVDITKVSQSLQEYIEGQNKALKESSQEKDNKMQELETKINSRFSEVDNLINNNHNSLKADHDKLKVSIEEESKKLQVDIEKASQNLQEYAGSQNKELKASLEEKAKELRELEGKLNSTYSEVNNIIKDNYTSLKEDCDKLRNLLAEESDKSQLDIKKVKELLTEASRLADENLSSQKNQHDTDLNDVKNQLKDLSEKSNKVVSDMNKELFDTLDDISSRIGSIEEKKKHQNDKIEELKGSTEANTKRIDHLENDGKDLKTQIDTANSKIKASEDEILKLVKEDQLLHENIQSTNTNLNELKSTLNGAIEGIEAHKKELGNITEKNEEGNLKIEDLAELLAKQANQITGLKDEGANTKDSIDFINEKIVQQDGINSKLEQKIGDCEEKDNQLLNKITELENSDKRNQDVQNVQDEVNKGMQATLDAYKNRLAEQESLSKANTDKIDGIGQKMEVAEQKLNDFEQYSKTSKEAEEKNGETTKEQELKLWDEIKNLEKMMHRQFESAYKSDKEQAEEIKELRSKANSALESSESVMKMAKELELKIAEIAGDDKDNPKIELIQKKLDDVVKAYTDADLELKKSFVAYVDDKFKKFEAPKEADDRFIQLDDNKGSQNNISKDNDAASKIPIKNTKNNKNKLTKPAKNIETVIPTDEDVDPEDPKSDIESVNEDIEENETQ